MTDREKYILGLQYALRIAKMQGYDVIIENVEHLLSLGESDLHTIYLHIGYLVYAQKDLASALSAIQAALKEYDDEQLRKVRSVLQKAVYCGKNEVICEQIDH